MATAAAKRSRPSHKPGRKKAPKPATAKANPGAPKKTGTKQTASKSVATKKAATKKAATKKAATKTVATKKAATKSVVTKKAATTRSATKNAALKSKQAAPKSKQAAPKTAGWSMNSEAPAASLAAASSFDGLADSIPAEHAAAPLPDAVPVERPRRVEDKARRGPDRRQTTLNRGHAPLPVIIHIPCGCTPEERQVRFERPLRDSLGKSARVMGGGSMTDTDGVSVTSVAIEVLDAGVALPILRRVLEGANAPSGTAAFRFEPYERLLVIDR